MCAQHAKQAVAWFRKPVIYALMIVLGILGGLSDVAVVKTIGHLITETFIRMFKCISLPIIALSIIVTLSNYRSDGMMRKVWRRTMCYTLATTLLAALISFILYLLIKPSLINSDPHTTQTAFAQQPGGYVQHLIHLIPTNFLAPFLENQVLSVLFMGIIVGIAIRFIPDEHARETITQFFRGAHGLFMVITRWIIAIIPIGLFGFITSTIVELRSGVAIKGLSEYLAIIVLANLLQGFVVLPLWLKAHGIQPFATMRAMLPALSLAFFSKSSVGTLPVTMDTVEKKLFVRPEISRFVLPLCTSINMNGCAAFIFTTVVYLMQNNGLEVTLTSMALWVVVSTVAAIGNAGIPMGCFFLSASLLSSMNIPITLMGIILPFYSLIDMLETALNVWSDSCVAKVVNQHVVASSTS